MRSILDDCAHALRRFRREPGFALLILLTLGSAMGVGTAFFSLVNLSWFRPWPVPDPDGVVVTRRYIPVDQARFWAENARSLRGVAWFRLGSTRERFEGHRVLLAFVSPNYFEVLGIPITRGRSLPPVDTEAPAPGAEGAIEPAAVISDRTWRLFFAADPQIVGRSITLDGKRVRVAGVAAPGFEGVEGVVRTHLWLPMSAATVLQPPVPGRDREKPWGRVFARRAPGVTTAQAEAELRVLSVGFPDDSKSPIATFSLSSTDGFSQRPPDLRAQAASYTLILAVAFLAMIACGNVSNLLLARGHARRGEIAVRLSLGASRFQIVRRLLAESFLLATGAGLVGIAVAMVLPEHIFATVPDIAELAQLSMRPDGRVFAWALAFSTFACLLFGLSPALVSTRLDVSRVLKDAGGVSSPALRTSLTAMQCLLSVAALGVAGLVLRSEAHVQARALARTLEAITIVRPETPLGYDSERRAAVARGFLAALESDLGSTRVAAASSEPRIDPSGARTNLAVTPAYFQVLGLDIVAGRTFAQRDARDDVVVVNEGMARALWPGESAIGHRLAGNGSDRTDREVIGVVKDPGFSQQASYTPLDVKDTAVIFVRADPARVRQRTALLKSVLGDEVGAEILDGKAWGARVVPMVALTSRVFGEFGGLVLILAATGLFGLSDYAVRQRTREIGIRRALGAGRARVLHALFRPTARSLAAGLVAGTVLAFVAGLVMRRYALPEGVDPFDFENYALVALAAAVVGAAAIWRPAQRALGVEPSVALRYE